MSSAGTVIERVHKMGFKVEVKGSKTAASQQSETKRLARCSPTRGPVCQAARSAGTPGIHLDQVLGLLASQICRSVAQGLEWDSRKALWDLSQRNRLLRRNGSVAHATTATFRNDPEPRKATSGALQAGVPCFPGLPDANLQLEIALCSHDLQVQGSLGTGRHVNRLCKVAAVHFRFVSVRGNRHQYEKQRLPVSQGATLCELLHVNSQIRDAQG